MGGEYFISLIIDSASVFQINKNNNKKITIIGPGYISITGILI